MRGMGRMSEHGSKSACSTCGWIGVVIRDQQQQHALHCLPACLPAFVRISSARPGMIASIVGYAAHDDL